MAPINPVGRGIPVIPLSPPVNDTHRYTRPHTHIAMASVIMRK